MRDKLEQLREVARLRNIQRVAAEHLAHRRDVELRAAQARHRDADAAMSRVEEAWQLAVNAPALDIALIGAWANDVRLHRANLDAELHLVEAGRNAHRRAVDQWRGILLREDIAEAVLSEARRAALRETEERRQMATEDRQAAGWRRT